MTKEQLQRIDEPCRRLVQAINQIPGLATCESCCGHGETPFRVWLIVTPEKGALEENTGLALLLYFLDACHIGFNWDCRVRTDCGMSAPTFWIESQVKGQKAYDQAEKIAKRIESQLNLK